MNAVGSALPMLPPILGAVLRPLPLLPLRLIMSVIAGRIRDRYPGMFERLGPHARKRFGLKPSDIPFAFVLEPEPSAPRISVVRHLPGNIDVRIEGSLAALLGMVDGTLDGDALFFSRKLQVQGDMEALLALRNAVDDARVDLRDIVLSLAGPLSMPLDRVARSTANAVRRRSGTRSEGNRWS